MHQFCDNWHVAIINHFPFCQQMFSYTMNPFLAAAFLSTFCYLCHIWNCINCPENIKVQTAAKSARVHSITKVLLTNPCGHYPTIQDGQTALEQASIKGHHNVVESLLGAGANPDLQDKVGKFIETVLCIQTYVMSMALHASGETRSLQSPPFWLYVECC